MNNIQLLQVPKFNIKNVIFSKPNTLTVKKKGKSLNAPSTNYKLIDINIKNEDGTIGALVLETEQLFSYGVQETRDQVSDELNGYKLPLCLWSKDGATEEQKEFTNTMNQITDACKKHLLENKEEIEKYDLDSAELKKFDPLVWKRERGKIVPGFGPTLYSKLIVSKKEGIKVLSIFQDAESGDPIDYLQLLNKYCLVKAAVKIEAIYIGNTCHLQVKLWEASVTPINGGMKPLLRRLTNVKPVAAKTEEVEVPNDIQSVGSISESDDEDYAAPPQKKAIKTRKR